MDASEIQIDGEYYAKVSGRRVIVWVTGTYDYMSGGARREGWTALNRNTGRQVRIQSPRRFLGPTAG